MTRNQADLSSNYSVGSNLENYRETFEEWDTAEKKVCPSCKGTGLDRDEWFDCETCGGEGEITLLKDVLDSRQSAMVRLR